LMSIGDAPWIRYAEMYGAPPCWPPPEGWNRERGEYVDDDPLDEPTRDDYEERDEG